MFKRNLFIECLKSLSTIHVVSISSGNYQSVVELTSVFNDVGFVSTSMVIVLKSSNNGKSLIEVNPLPSTMLNSEHNARKNRLRYNIST